MSKIVVESVAQELIKGENMFIVDNDLCKRIKISLNSIDDLNKFVALSSKFEEDIDAMSLDGNYIVNGKSILGIVSLDLTKPIYACIYSNDSVIDGQFIATMRQFSC